MTGKIKQVMHIRKIQKLTSVSRLNQKNAETQHALSSKIQTSNNINACLTK